MVDDDTLVAALQFVELDSLVVPCGGLDSPCAGVMTGLSAGQCQRLSAARLLVQRPQFVLLDECTSSVTTAFERALFQRLVSDGVGMVTVSHHGPAVRSFHTHVLTLREDGWSFDAAPRD